MLYTTRMKQELHNYLLFYQDFKDTFVCYTQQRLFSSSFWIRCFIRISKILLYAIHNELLRIPTGYIVVLSGFQRYFCMLYTTYVIKLTITNELFYQDFKDTFVCYTQQGIIMKNQAHCCFIRISKILLYAIHNSLLNSNQRTSVVLSGFQRYFCMLYTT